MHASAHTLIYMVHCIAHTRGHTHTQRTNTQTYKPTHVHIYEAFFTRVEKTKSRFGGLINLFWVLGKWHFFHGEWSYSEGKFDFSAFKVMAKWQNPISVA